MHIFLTSIKYEIQNIECVRKHPNYSSDDELWFCFLLMVVAVSCVLYYNYLNVYVGHFDE